MNNELEKIIQEENLDRENTLKFVRSIAKPL